MKTLTVQQAQENFTHLVDQVYSEGISVDLKREDKVIARITPAEPASGLTVGNLNAFLQSLPALGDDAEQFAQDVHAIRAKFPAEKNPWE